MRKFDRNVSETIATTQINLSGFINEQADFGMPKFTKHPNLIINFSSVTLINSTGVMKWVTWITQVVTGNPKLKIMFANVPKVIMDQVNLVKNFMPAGVRMKSFYLPFFCEGCNLQSGVTLENGKDFATAADGQKPYILIPKITCPQCGEPMAEDFVASKYLKFLEN
jgi:hypothetical protein